MKYTSNKIISKGDPFIITKWKGTTIRELERLVEADFSSYSTFRDIVNSETAMNAIVNSKTAMNAIVNSETAMNAIVNSETAMNAIVASSIAVDMISNSLTAIKIVANSSFAINMFIDSVMRDIFLKSPLVIDIFVNSRIAMDTITKSSTIMDSIITSEAYIEKIIRSAIALYYICVNNASGLGLEKLASNITGTTTLAWEDEGKWQIIYDTLHTAPDLFAESYIRTGSYVTVDATGDLINLIIQVYSKDKDVCEVSVTPRYSGCYSHGRDYGYSSGKHIMWGGQTTYNEYYTCSYIRFYKFTPIT